MSASVMPSRRGCITSVSQSDIPAYPAACAALARSGNEDASSVPAHNTRSSRPSMFPPFAHCGDRPGRLYRMASAGPCGACRPPPFSSSQDTCSDVVGEVEGRREYARRHAGPPEPARRGTVHRRRRRHRRRARGRVGARAAVLAGAHDGRPVVDPRRVAPPHARHHGPAGRSRRRGARRPPPTRGPGHRRLPGRRVRAARAAAEMSSSRCSPSSPARRSTRT